MNAFWLGAMDKLAYGRNSSVGPTTDRDGPQTSGEQGVEQSSTSHGSSHYTGTKANAVRGPGNQGGRGTPEWLRMLKMLPSPGSQNVGDKTKAPGKP